MGEGDERRGEGPGEERREGTWGRMVLLSAPLLVCGISSSAAPKCICIANTPRPQDDAGGHPTRALCAPARVEATGYFCVAKNSTRFRRSCFESGWAMLSGIGDGAALRTLMS